MSKLDDLKELYDKLDMNTPGERDLLAKVRSGQASQKEVNSLLDAVQAPGYAAILDEIKAYENGLVAAVGRHEVDIRSLHDQYLEAAQLDDGPEKDNSIADLERRQKAVFEEADETREALTGAFFQVRDFDQYGRRLDKAKENYEI